MKLIYIVITIFSIGILLPAYSFGVETAPRITDREIIEGLADIRGDIKEIRADIRRLEDKIDQVEKNMNQRFDDMNQRFDDLKWMMGLFISISLIILGFVLRMQWQMNRRQAQMETTLETHKDSPR